MAEEKITVNGGDNWKLQVDRVGTATLATAGKYVDRNIEVEVPHAEYDVTASGNAVVNNVPVVESGIDLTATDSIKNAATIVDTAPTEGKYYVITPTTSVTNTGTATVSISAKTTVNTPGFLEDTDGKTQSADDINITGIGISASKKSSLYLPVSTVTEDNITAATEHLSGDGTKKDSLTVNIDIPAGYYEKTVISKNFTDLLQDIDDDAAAEHILYGMQAYDENGNLLQGTMSNHSADKPVVEKKGVGSTSISGTAVELSDNDSSGIAITASGTIGAQARITASGYYEASASNIENYTSAADTKYITAISLGEDKTLDSISIASGAVVGSTDEDGNPAGGITNNGTILSLNGVGTIKELSGTQDVDKLKGTLNVKTSVDEDGSVAGTPGKIIFNGTTMVADGAIVEAQQDVSGDTFTVSPGWVTSPINSKVDKGEYGVSCTKVDPSIEYSATGAGAKISTSETGYAINFKGTVTEGSHTAVATVTKSGYIAAGSKPDNPTPESIGVRNADKTTTVYLAEAEFSQGLSTTKYTDNPSVSRTYQFSASSEGYTDAGVKLSVDVFDGVFSWG